MGLVYNGDGALVLDPDRQVQRSTHSARTLYEGMRPGGVLHGEPVCQHVPGAGVHRAIGELLVEAVNPVALEVTLAVQRELQSRLDCRRLGRLVHAAAVSLAPARKSAGQLLHTV